MVPEITTPYLVLFSLSTVRIGAALRLLPFFGGVPVPALPWLGLSVCLALVITPYHPLGEAPLPTTVLSFVALAMKELFIGIVVGLLARMAFSVLEMTARLAETLALPFCAPETETGIRTFYTLVGTTIFFIVGGHHGVIDGVLATFRCQPVLTMPAVTLGPEPVIRLLTAAMAAAVLAATPLFAAGLIADMVVGGVFHILAGAPVFGAAAVRSIVVLVAAVASLGAVVSATLTFLQATVERFAMCGAI